MLKIISGAAREKYIGLSLSSILASDIKVGNTDKSKNKRDTLQRTLSRFCNTRKVNGLNGGCI
jgi:hypothetical protein